MRICRLTTEDFDEFLKFNQKIDPSRNDVVERFQFQVLDNPLLKDKTEPYILVSYNDEGQIVGQHLHNPFEYYFKGKKLHGFYGFDFFVPEEHRNQGIGSAIARQASTEFYPHFGIGVSEISQRIQLALGNRIIGHLFSYIWIRNWLSPIKFGWSQISKKKSQNNSVVLNCGNLPDQINIKQHQFKRITSLTGWDYGCWNHDILEFSRSLEFINWRFFKKKDRYCFYLINESASNTYFVVRAIWARGLRLLALIDYRVPFADKMSMQIILQATKKVAKIGGFDGVFTMSSYQFFDKIFSSNLFFKVGRPIVIMTNAELDIDRQRIDERKAVLATMAESDLDFYFTF